MRLTNFMTVNGVNATVACPNGAVIRILSILASMPSPSPEVAVSMQRAGIQFAICSTGLPSPQAIAACFFIGGQVNQPPEAVVDTVTGVVTLGQQFTANSGLPEIRFPFDVSLVLSAWVTNFVVTYEIITDE